MSLKSKAKVVHTKFSKKNLTLALAESCTGGLVAATLTEIPGSSKYFLGGIVSYANSAKHDLLRVSEKILKTHGAVSRECVKQMALGARKVFKANYAVSVSGIAGPDGGTPLKPVGLVFFAVAGPKFVRVKKRNFRGSRKKIQRAAAQEALELLLKNLK